MATRTHIPPSVLTYRFHNKMVYVTPANHYEEALDFAQDVFPELAKTARDQISFSVTKKAGDDKKSAHIRIGPMAWVPVVASLPQYHFIDVHVKPTFVVPDIDAPPQYPEHESKEPFDYSQSRSVPSSPHLRPQSDTKGKRARSWFGKA